MMTTLKSLFSPRSEVRRCLSVLLVLFAAVTACGQTEAGRLVVSVVDIPNGEAVADATVALRGLDTGQQRVQRTGSNGQAIFFGLEAGRYEVSVVRNGASIISRTVDIEVGAERLVRFQIPVGLGAVGVEATSTETRGVGQTTEITAARRDELLRLPNLNNDLTPLLEAVPGAVPGGPASLGRVIIDGKGRDQQTLRLDGLDATPQVEIPSGDGAMGIVESFQQPSVALNQKNSSVVSMAFEPLNGPGTGSVQNNVTQSGVTNKLGLAGFHIEGYDVLRNDALNARNFFDTAEKNGIRRNQFGTRLSGPIEDRKAFFFFGYEGIRGRTEQNMFEAVPTEALCRCGAGAVSPFLGGYLPRGTDVVPGVSGNPDFIVARRRARTTSESNAFDFRLDWLPFALAPTTAGVAAIDPKPAIADTFIFRFTRQAADTLVPDGVTGRLQRQRILFVNALARAELFTKNYTHSIKVGFNQTRAHVDTALPLDGQATLPQALITIGGSVSATGLPGGLTSVPVATLGGFAKGSGRGFDLTPYSLIFSHDANRILNSDHVLSFGGEARFTRLRFDRLGGLTYAFPNVAALRAAAPGTVTFLSDLSGPSPFTDGAGPRHARQNYFAAYFQGVWKWRPSGAPEPSLAVTYGLRYDYFGPVSERDNRAVVVDPSTGEILPRGTPFYRTAKNNFQPRVGVEYVLRHGGVAAGFFNRTTLRTGAGLYSGVPRIGDLLLPIESDRFSTGVTGGTFPADPTAVVSGFVNSPDTRQYQPIAFARNFSTPERVYKWNAGLTQTLGLYYDFKLTYAGNAGRHLPLATIADPIVRVETNPDPTKAAIIVREFDIVRGGQVFKPYGEFFFRTSQGRSNFNALTVALQRNNTASNSDRPIPLPLRFSDFKIQYTLSRNVGNTSGAVASNPSDFDADYGYNASDARHSFTFSAAYPLMNAKVGSRRSDLLWGWTVATKLTARSGLPLIVRLDRPDVVYVDAAGNVFSSPAAGRTAVINTPGGGASGGARVPDLIPGVNPFINRGTELLNPAAFAIPKPGTFGNLRRGALRGPSSVSLDFALTRHLFDAERTKGFTTDLKIEFFNVLNHANFNNPTASLPNVLGTNAAGNQIQPGAAFTRAAAGGFGILSAADPGRQIQLTVLLKFN